MIGTDGKPVNCECNIYDGATPSDEYKNKRIDREYFMPLFSIRIYYNNKLRNLLKDLNKMRRINEYNNL